MLLTTIQKIKRLTHWNDIEKLKDVLFDLLNGSGGGGDVEEAPEDGQQYARQDAGWSIVTGGGGSPQGIQSVLGVSGTITNSASIYWDNPSIDGYTYITDQGLSLLKAGRSTSLVDGQVNVSSLIFTEYIAQYLAEGVNFSRQEGIPRVQTQFNYPVDKPADYVGTFAMLDDITGGGTTINKAFVTAPSSAVMSVAFDVGNPNLDIYVNENLDLTITGTVNGDSGLINLYFSSTWEAVLNGDTNLTVIGEGIRVLVYFIHDSDGLKWYNPLLLSKVNLQSVLNNGTNATKGTSYVDILSEDAPFTKFSAFIDNDTPGSGQQSGYFSVTTVNTVISHSGNDYNELTEVTVSQNLVRLQMQNQNGSKTRNILMKDLPLVNSNTSFPNPTKAGTYTLATTEDTTTTFHFEAVTNVGTITNVGNICSGSVDVPVYFPIGSKIVKSNGETGIVATMELTGEFTTEDPFATDSTDIGYTCYSVATKVSTDGSVRIYDSGGTNRFTLASNGQIDIIGTTFSGNGNIGASVLSLSSATTYINDAAADADGALISGSLYFITGDRVARKKP